MILGMGTDAEPVVYGVFIYRDETVWSLEAVHLPSTGEFARWEHLYEDATVIRVQVDESGRGILAE